MFATFVVMAAIEISLLIDKPNARYFAVTILAVGLILRGLVQERRMKKEGESSPREIADGDGAPIRESTPKTFAAESILCAIRAPGGHSTSHCAKRTKQAHDFTCSSSANSSS